MHSHSFPHFDPISRSRLFKAISAGLLPAEFSQLVKSLIRTPGSTAGWLLTTRLAALCQTSSHQLSS
jgi:hypothetical protein